MKDLSATRLREGDAVLAVLRGLDARSRWRVFSNLGSAYVAPHQRRAGVDRLRRAGAEALQVRRRRARRRRARPSTARRGAQGRAGRRGQQARLRPALRAATRTASCRRAPAAGSPSRPRATRSSASRASRATRTSSAWSPATRARCSARPTSSPSWPSPGRGVTVIKVGRRRDGGRLRRRPARRTRTSSSPRPTTARSCPSVPDASHVTARGGKGHALKRKTQDRARDARAEPLAPTAAAGAAELTMAMASASYTSERHHGPRGPRAGPQAARHVHRRHRQHGLPPPAVGDRRQLGRRGDQRLRDAHRGDARTRTARRVTVDDNGRGIPVDINEAVQEVGARADPHDAARGRQVRRGAATSSRAACTASARRWSTRCRRS